MTDILAFLGRYGTYLQGSFGDRLPFLGFSALVFVLVVIHLVVTHHAEFTGNMDAEEIGCGDVRVWKALVIFGGPAAFTFGLPYYWMVEQLASRGQTFWADYVGGFAVLQFALGVVQLVILFAYAVFMLSKWQVSTVKWKSHLDGCAWITGTGILWPVYVIQQITHWQWLARIRDVETIVLFFLGIISLIVPAVCIVESILSLKIVYPWLSDVDTKPHHDRGPAMTFD